jgi:pantothenate synthetase
MQVRRATDSLAAENRAKYEGQLSAQEHRHAEQLAAAQAAMQQLQEEATRAMQDSISHWKQQMDDQSHTLSRMHLQDLRELETGLAKQQALHEQKVIYP